MKYLLVALLALPLCGQGPVQRQLLPQVRGFLQLTDAQVLGIVLNNDTYNRGIQERIQRIRQVQMEIAVETQKLNLDSDALGVRYAEIEWICRDLRDMANRLQQQNLSLLNEEQRKRLKTLEEVMRMVPLMGEAQMSNLLGNWNTAPAGLNGSSSPAGAPGIGVNAVFGCPGTGILALQPAQ